MELSNIPDTVILAGANGVGKSTILEAIMFLKEGIAPYPPYENTLSPYVQQRLPKVISANEETTEINAIFELSDFEIYYLKKLFPQRLSEVKNSYDITYTIQKGGGHTHNCPDIFSSLFKIPDRLQVPEIGIIDQIDAHRVFSPITMTDIYIDQRTINDIQRRILPGTEKFNNFKQLLLKLRIGELIEKDRSSSELKNEDEFRSKLKLDFIRKLFDLIPPKQLGDIDIEKSPVQITVRTPLGVIDIDELSSGEKEILFVLSDLYSLKINNSILLLDEPDLHLNESIQDKIIEILQSMGSNNQIWISTHSTGIINAIDYSSLFRVNTYSGNNQITKILDDTSKIALIESLVGSRSILTVGENIVFIEGIEKNDKYILEKWFDKKLDKIVFVSVDSVNNINKINNVNLSLLNSSIKYTYFFCIRDRDFIADEDLELKTRDGQGKIFYWNRYHIENFLIDGQAIYNIFDLYHDNPFQNANDCIDKMKELVVQNRTSFVNKFIDFELRNIFRFNNVISIKDNSDAQGIEKEVDDFKDELLKLSSKKINIKDLIAQSEEKFDKIIQDGTWINILPGREILKNFLNKFGKKGMSWEIFRNSLVKEIKTLGIPKEVSDIIDSIKQQNDLNKKI